MAETTTMYILREALQVTAFVAVMMIAVEYCNVLTRGAWPRFLSRSPWAQYVGAVLLGAMPGCLGAFAFVALYTHRMVSMGALVACMIATSGDEAFVMLALFPGKAILLTLGVSLVGLGAGLATDRLGRGPLPAAPLDCYVLHEEEPCECFPRGRLLEQLRDPTPARGVLVVAMGLLLLALLTGMVGPSEWNWLRGTLLAVTGFSLFVVLTVPEHFLEEHLWRHTARQHVPGVFLWTLGALAVVGLVERLLPPGGLSLEGRWLAMVGGSLLGLVPESGPHLLVVNLYDKGLAPLGALVASSIVQDGHGMLPLLAHSKRDFLRVKGINLLAGLAVGGLLTAFGW
jgi:hypothetical protein